MVDQCRDALLAAGVAAADIASDLFD
jgi:hypothetical protein